MKEWSRKAKKDGQTPLQVVFTQFAMISHIH